MFYFYGLIFVLALAGPASTQEATRFQAPPADLPTYQVLRTDQGIQVDGRLDEADWQRTAPIAFVMPWSDLTKEAPQSTTARLLWDDDNLYIIYECVDPHLDSEVTAHDGPVYREDAVEIFAAPNAATPGNYYGYEMNINGTLLDYIAFDGGAERTKAIHPSWQSEGVVIATTYDGTLNDHSDTDQSWILEIAIPHDNFRHLGGQLPPQDGDQWRVGLNRTKGDHGQFGLWSDTGTPVPDFHRANRFGVLTFSAAVVGH